MLQSACCSGGRRLRMHAPEKIVRELDGRRRLERHDMQAERIDFVKHRADRAVLAARVHALQHQQHAAFALRVQTFLQVVEL